MSLLLTSHRINSATTSIIYRRISILRSRKFQKFLSRITDVPALGEIVRRLDFSHFNPTGAGLTARERAETLNLTSKTLLQCLHLTPNIQEFLVQEHVDEDLDYRVMEKLLCHLPNLKAVDFTACSSSDFCRSFTRLIETNPSPLPSALSITRLCLHNCNSLPPSVFSTLLPKIPYLTHLDVSHTQITDSALKSLQETACITHLNLSRCARLTGVSVVDFLIHHASVKSLIYLNLAMDTISQERFDCDNIVALLPRLPRSLRSLNLKGSKMTSSHVSLLLPLTKHLEEFSVGRHLVFQDLIHLLLPDDSISLVEQVAWTPHTLRYLDISDLTAAQLDLWTMFSISCPLFKSITEPLEVLEINPMVQRRVLSSSATLKRVGWGVVETGNRTSLVRNEIDYAAMSGARDWKWGVINWGMRKIPVARAGEGGMYGYWMFKYAK